MEHQKDTQKDIIPVYGASNDFYEHSRKIVTAIYLLSDLFEDREPLKWSLREKTIEVMSYTGVLSRSVGPLVKDTDGSHIIALVSEIRSLLDIGELSGVVSPMNHDVLSRELAVFQENAVRHQHLMNGNQSLYTESLFTGFDWSISPKTAQLSQGHFKKTSNRDKGHKNVQKTNSKNVFENKKDKTIGQSDTSNERKEKIFGLIESKGNVMIKDISPNFPEYSEKTIQRDLLDLVSQGRIKKSGERRWTVYSTS